MFDELKCTEYMWDWEGKFVDEAVVEKLFQKYFKYFKRHALGKDVFLTFRIPNTDEESGYRLARAFMAMLTADDLAHEIGMHVPPIFEVILPMTVKRQPATARQKDLPRSRGIQALGLQHQAKRPAGIQRHSAV